MSRKIDITFQGNIARIALRRVDRSRLYGSTRRTGLDAPGRECASALLTRDGKYVLGPGSTAGMYLNEKGDFVAREDLERVDNHGQQSNGGRAPNGLSELTGPVPVEELLECVVNAIYEIDASNLDSSLATSLLQGDIYRAPDKGFLLANEHGAFLLAMKPARFDFVERDRSIMIDDYGDDEYDDLGFEEM